MESNTPSTPALQGPGADIIAGAAGRSFVQPCPGENEAPLLDAPPAIDHKTVPGDERKRIAGEEITHPCHIARCAEPPRKRAFKRPRAVSVVAPPAGSIASARQANAVQGSRLRFSVPGMPDVC